MALETAHLRLLPYAAEHLLALIEGEQQFEAAFGLPAAEGLRAFILSDDVSPEWVAHLHDASGVDPWVHGFAIVHRESGSVIGTVGFKGPPDEQGTIEIGYGIVPAFQSRGYATEAAEAALAFAFSHHEVRLVRAHTLPARNASTRVLTKCCFQHLGEVTDPEDGLVWRWERSRGAGGARSGGHVIG